MSVEDLKLENDRLREESQGAEKAREIEIELGKLKILYEKKVKIIDRMRAEAEEREKIINENKNKEINEEKWLEEKQEMKSEFEK